MNELTVKNYFLGSVHYIKKGNKHFELSLTYDGKPSHVWISAKLFRQSLKTMGGRKLDTSKPFEKKPLTWETVAPLDLHDNVEIEAHQDAEYSEPVDKDGNRLMRDGTPVIKYTFKLNSLDEIRVVEDEDTAETEEEDSIPDPS